MEAHDEFVTAAGGRATAFFTQLGPDEWRVSLLLENPTQAMQQTIGPETFRWPTTAYEWIVQQAAKHGFEEGEFAMRGYKLE
jgi:hypothetical protein